MNITTLAENTLDKTRLTFIYCSSLESIILPNSLTEIDYGVFCGCESLKSIAIPDGVTAIGRVAFKNCTQLTEIDIPDSVIDIGEQAFSGTEWYANQPDGIVYAGKVAYNYKGEQPKEIDIKDGTLGIARGAFPSYDDTLENVIIPDTVVNIGNYAFNNCKGLKSIIIPQSVTTIGVEAFGYYSPSPDVVLPVEGFTIYGYTGTAAHTYADENGFAFIDLNEHPMTLLGDVDSDREITILDATTIQRHLVSLSTQMYNEEAADCDSDEEVTIIDATCIQRHLAGIPTLAKGIGKPIV